jgi:hypothetical protein
MMKKLGLAALVVVVALAGVAGYAASQPSTLRVTRSRNLAAAPDVVFSHVSNFHKWSDWSPWDKLDPNMTQEFSGPEAGTGAQYDWSGNSEVGQGRMTITDCQPNESLTIKLEFLKPWEGISTTQFDFTPSVGGTTVTWTMTGERHFLCKLMGLFFNLETMIGDEFEKGLATLDTVTAAESESGS